MARQYLSKKRGLVHALQFKMRFRVSGLYISIIPPIVVGVAVGVLAAIMGVGGGFVMVPAMIYLLGMPTKVVVGTSLFQIIFVTAFTTMLHATTNYTVDIQGAWARPARLGRGHVVWGGGLGHLHLVLRLGGQDMDATPF